jgi:hypothetical protein
MSQYNYEVKEPPNFLTRVLDNYMNDLFTAIILVITFVLTYTIKEKVLPKLNKIDRKLETKKNKLEITVEDSTKILSALGSLNVISKSFKSLLVLFHDKDDYGYFTKYSIQYQVAINGYEVLRENFTDLDIRILDAEIQNMRNNNGYHIVYKRNYHLTKRMQQWMNKQNIVSAYAKLIYDSNGNEVGAVYLDFNTEVDNSIITDKLNELIDTIEAVVSPYYLS